MQRHALAVQRHALPLQHHTLSLQHHSLPLQRLSPERNLGSIGEVGALAFPALGWRKSGRTTRTPAIAGRVGDATVQLFSRVQPRLALLVHCPAIAHAALIAARAVSLADVAAPCTAGVAPLPRKKYRLDRGSRCTRLPGTRVAASPSRCARLPGTLSVAVPVQLFSGFLLHSQHSLLRFLSQKSRKSGRTTRTPAIAGRVSDATVQLFSRVQPRLALLVHCLAIALATLIAARAVTLAAAAARCPCSVSSPEWITGPSPGTPARPSCELASPSSGCNRPLRWCCVQPPRPCASRPRLATVAVSSHGSPPLSRPPRVVAQSGHELARSAAVQLFRRLQPLCLLYSQRSCRLRSRPLRGISRLLRLSARPPP